jgi:hypothetical protein
MNHIAAVAVSERFDYLSHVMSSHSIDKELFFGQLLVEFAIRSVFEHQIRTRVIVEVAMHSQDVRVAKTHLNLDLAF